MSVKDLKKALEQKAKTLAELNKQCRHTWRVCKDCMAHCEFKDTEQFKGKWLSLEDVEAFLVELFLEKVIVPHKQLEDLDKGFPSINSRKYYENGTIDYIKWATDVIRWRGKFQDFRFGLLEKELLEATLK